MSWLDAFFSAYGTVQSDGTALPQRSVLNFLDTLVVTDDPTNARTNVSADVPDFGAATAATPDTYALRGASAEIYFGTVNVIAGASLAVASAAALSAAGLVFDVANVAPTIGHTVVAGTGATAGVPFPITAQPGRQQSGGNANNAGGALVLAGGAAGTGGGGAAGLPGPVTIKSGAANVGSFGNAASGTVATYTLDPSRTSMVWNAAETGQSQAMRSNGPGGSVTLEATDGGFIATKTDDLEFASGAGVVGVTVAVATTTAIWSFGPLITLPSIRHTVKAGTGATVGVTAIIQAQAGQQQTGGAANNAGGILKLGGGPAGTGGAGAGALSGATQIDLGTAVSNVSALCSFLVGGASILDVSQSAASTALIKAAGKLTIELPISNLFQIKGTTVKHIDTASNFVFDAGFSGGINANSMSLAVDLVWINGKNIPPKIWQNDFTTNAAAAQTLTINGANATGTTSTGAAVDIRTGTGTTTAGLMTLRAGATTKLSLNATGLGLFATTPVAQPTRAGQLTDNSGGTSGGNTIAAIVGAVDPTAATVASTANAIATLAARLNLLEGKISAAGTGIGVTA